MARRRPRADSGVRAGWIWLLAVAVFGAALIGCGSDNDTAADDLIGTWVNAGGPTWEISDSGSITVVGGAATGFDYTVTDTTLELTTLPGAEDCPEASTGVYEWAIEEEVLTLTLVSDACNGRGNGLDGRSFDRSD